jgi:hypothetical protein
MGHARQVGAGIAMGRGAWAMVMAGGGSWAFWNEQPRRKLNAVPGWKSGLLLTKHDTSSFRSIIV